MEFPPSRCIETLPFYQCVSFGFRTLRGHYYRAGAASAGILSGDAWEILECQGIGFIGNLGWFPSSGLGTHVLQSSRLVVSREAGASKTAFPSWSLGTSGRSGPGFVIPAQPFCARPGHGSFTSCQHEPQALYYAGFLGRHLQQAGFGQLHFAADGGVEEIAHVRRLRVDAFIGG